MQIATGETDEGGQADDGKDRAAVLLKPSLGQRGLL
jgi:hypothetical protein